MVVCSFDLPRIKRVIDSVSKEHWDDLRGAGSGLRQRNAQDNCSLTK